MKQLNLLKTLFLLCALMVGSSSAWAEEVTYTISAKNTLTTTGTAPAGSSATIAETYGTSKQMTNGNSQTLTLKKYEGYKITKLVLSMHSNKSAGSGKLAYSTDGGSEYVYLVGSESSGVQFNNAAWYGGWTQEYVNVTKSDLDIICGAADVIIKIAATANSLFCESYTITYEAYDMPKHTVTFYENGKKLSDAEVAEGASVVFPTPTAYAGYTFKGWATAAIVGKQVDAPVTVTSAIMGTSDVTYYAVYGKPTTKDVSVSFDASDISNLSSAGTRKWKENTTGIELYISAGQRYTGGTPNTWTVTKSTASDDYYLSIGLEGCQLKSVVVTVSGTDYAVGNYYAYAKVSDEDGTDLTSTVTTVDKVSTLNLTSSYEQVVLWSSTSNQIRATKIDVDATVPSLTDFCTTLTESATIGEAGWATWIAPATVEVPAGVSAYIVTSNTTNATLAELLVIPADAPVVLKGDAGSYVFSVCGDDLLTLNESDPATNLLEISDEATTNGVFVLAKKTSHGVGFYQWNGGLLGAGKVYLPASGGARDFLGFGETTAIESVAKAQTIVNTVIYNLAGQRVAQPTKGLYIVNGKKVVIK